MFNPDKHTKCSILCNPILAEVKEHLRSDLEKNTLKMFYRSWMYYRKTRVPFHNYQSHVGHQTARDYSKMGHLKFYAPPWHHLWCLRYLSPRFFIENPKYALRLHNSRWWLHKNPRIVVALPLNLWIRGVYSWEGERVYANEVNARRKAILSYS